MLKNFDFTKTDHAYMDRKTKDLSTELDKLQRQLQADNIPVLILLDGWESAGKGYILNEFTREMDPRYVRVEVFEEETDIEKQHPSAWRYWQKIPSKQEFVLYDRSFYYQVFNYSKQSKDKLQQKMGELISFEQALLDDGMIVLKFFLNISQESQAQRIKDLEKDENQYFLVSKEDKLQTDNYKKYKKWFNKVLKATNLEHSPWHIINAEDKKLAAQEVLGLSIDLIKEGMEQVLANRKQIQASQRTYQAPIPFLEQMNLNQTMSEEDYQARKEELQDKAAELVYDCYIKDIPIVLAFEGIDAAGKGGAIQRLTRMIDPRSYKTYGIKAPSPDELAHHYLWRFMSKFPKDGLMAIFDRSWYGRVLVERIEGFATEKEWERAYGEINTMEKTLADHGTIVLKFFLFVDKDEQAKRFKDREEEVDKNYKITEEDWRNRDKWDQYILAFEEMLDRTNTPEAPWKIIASNDKYTARIQVLEAFVEQVESKLKSLKEDK